MSFVRTLATLAAGYAAAKGADKFKEMGGMKGLQDMMSGAGGAGGENPLGDMMQKMGLPGGDALQGMLGQLTGAGAAAGGAGAAGLGGLMAALGGAQATGQEQAASMMDALTGTTVATDTQENNAKLMIRAMIQAAKADGEIDEDEKAKILEHMGEMGPEELAFVKAELAGPIDIEGLAADTSDQMKAQVYAVSLMAVKVDHTSEVSYLNGLADAMGLSPQIRDQVHRSMGIS
ncbi:MAG: DUF533 domain-containing protein [Pseudomonadota bacterium]